MTVYVWGMEIGQWWSLLAFLSWFGARCYDIGIVVYDEYLQDFLGVVYT